jgi:cysteinyl-tRNA synthetase
MRSTLGTGQVVVSPDEDRELYHIHLQTFCDNHQPQGATEGHLVQSLADVSWRLNRVVALETNILSISYTPAALVDGLFDQAKALANLSMHSQRLSRQFERTVAQLRELQTTRRSQEQHQLDNLLDIIEMHEEKGEAYNPSEDGFVFSPSQITQAIQARNRNRILEETHRAAA